MSHHQGEHTSIRYVKTCWRCYVINFKYKLTLTYCAFGWLLQDSLLNNAWNERCFSFLVLSQKELTILVGCENSL